MFRFSIFKDWFIIGLELDYEFSELLFQSVATKEGKKFVEKGRKGKKEGKGRKNSARGKAHKESSSRKHNQKAPEDTSFIREKTYTLPITPERELRIRARTKKRKKRRLYP